MLGVCARSVNVLNAVIAIALPGIERSSSADAPDPALRVADPEPFQEVPGTL